MALQNKKILKVAGLSLVGFCAVSLGVDKANVGPIASQVAGFCGAFVGGWVGARRRRRIAAAVATEEQPQLPVEPDANAAVTPSSATSISSD
jgi:hypothetical protein